MIRSFADKRTQQFFEGKRVAAFEAFAIQARRRLAVLDTAETLRALQALQALPSNRLEALSGDRVYCYSIRVNDRWRICFAWEPDSDGVGDILDRPGAPTCVEIVDYH